MSVEDASGDAAGIPLASHSVTLLIQQLKSDSSDAPGRIWSRFFERLLPIAKSRLRGLRDHSVDEEDVLVSVFDLFFRAAREGRFVKLEDRDDLWQILLLLTDRKVSEQYRRSHAQKRGAAQMELAGDTLDGLRGDSPPPEFFVAFNENLTRALGRLQTQQLRDVALLRLEGYGNSEIAERLQIGLSSVERKLRLIRREWEGDFMSEVD